MKDVYWIGDPAETRLAIVPRPRGGDWLEADLQRLKREGVDVLVSMLTSEEELELDLARERELADRSGLLFYSYSVTDRSVPADSIEFRVFIHRLIQEVAAGRNVAAHCRGSIGRATIVTACVLIDQGWTADRALTAIETARERPVPDTEDQRGWIEHFANSDQSDQSLATSR